MASERELAILEQLTKITDDHEKRLRFLERAVFSALAIVGITGFIWKSLR